MNLGELLRFKGVLIAAGVLLLVVFISAFATKSLQQNSLQSALVVQKIESLSAFHKPTKTVPSSGEFAAWKEQLNTKQRQWLEQTSGAQLSSVRSAVVEGDAGRFARTMASLKKHVSDQAAKRDRLLSMAPLAICLFAVLIYLLAIIPQLLRLSSDAEVQVESNQQAENILNTVSEGLFLLDKSGEIGVEQSKSLKGMFRMERDLEGSFLDFIGQYVPESTVAVAKDYLDLLYGDRVKEKLVKDLNPLNKVEVSITRRDGTIESRFLDFNFARVMVDSELQHLLGSVTDVTREVKLELELEQNKQEQEAQLDLLMNILHLDKNSLNRFYAETEESLESINETLQERGHSSDQIRNKLNTIAEQAHKIKGDAAVLKLHNFEFIMHEFESEVAKVQESKSSLTGRDVLPAVTQLKAVFKELNNMQSIVTRFSEVLKMERGQMTGTDVAGAAEALEASSISKEAVSSDDVSSNDELPDQESQDQEVQSQNESVAEAEPTAETEEPLESVSEETVPDSQGDETQADDDSSVAEDSQVAVNNVEKAASMEIELQDLVQTVADRNGVKVRLQTLGLESVPQQHAKVIRDSSIQFLRNSVAHGARSPEERVANGKPEYMTVKMVVQANENGHTLLIRDDGEGLNRQKIIDKAIEKGLIPAGSEQKVTAPMLAKIVFHPGFSTRDEADLDAGRGVGLSAVHTMIKESGGVLGFSHEEGQHCQFSVRFKS